MGGEEVAARDDLHHVLAEPDMGEPLRQLGEEGVVGQHLHVEARGPPGHAPGHRTEAQKAQRLAADVEAGIGLPLSLPDPAVRQGDAPGAGEHQPKGQVRHGVGVGAGGVAHGDAQVLGGVQGDVVQARAVLADQLQLFTAGHQLRGKGVGPDDEDVAVQHRLRETLHVKIRPHHRHGASGPLQDVHGGGVDGPKGPGCDQNLFTHRCGSSLECG